MFRLDVMYCGFSIRDDDVQDVDHHSGDSLALLSLRGGQVMPTH